MKDLEKEVFRIASDDLEFKVRFATDTLRKVTPVDTGNARSSWENEILFKDGAVDEAEITSDADYMVFLNDGSSRQAPAFFIEQVLMTIGVITS
jgi:hypothetical protein